MATSGLGRGWSMLTAALGLVGVAGCATPQLDALRRDFTADPRERVRIYESCRARSETFDAMNACMEGEGYRFVSAADQDYRATECWDDRYRSSLPKAYCWDPATEPSP